ncbi:MAG: hypothetical protein KF894_03055 [Labilithrix sp.]|nr:hypothetical protein [Labilithrix sp.]
MTGRALTLAASVALAAMVWTSAAEAAPARRVVVAGPAEDTIANRIQSELAALGFEALRVGALDGCARSAVGLATRDAEAVAATCSDGDQVGVWVADGDDLRLRDVVVVREDGEPGRETTAVRAAEVTRATISAYEAEEETRRETTPPPTRAPSPTAAPPTGPAAWETVDRPSQKPRPSEPSPRRAPTVLAGAGLGALMGVDASTLVFSGQAEVGVLRHLTATARIEYPIESSALGLGSTLSVAPAFAGGGVGVPLASPESFVIPRLGAGLGVAWLRATRPESAVFDANGSFFTQPETSDSVASLAGYATAGISMRIYRPLRLIADGLFGSTTSRLVARDRGMHVAYWGAPFGALSLRAELLFR